MWGVERGRKRKRREEKAFHTPPLYVMRWLKICVGCGRCCGYKLRRERLLCVGVGRGTPASCYSTQLPGVFMVGGRSHCRCRHLTPRATSKEETDAPETDDRLTSRGRARELMMMYPRFNQYQCPPAMSTGIFQGTLLPRL